MNHTSNIKMFYQIVSKKYTLKGAFKEGRDVAAGLCCHLYRTALPSAVCLLIVQHKLTSLDRIKYFKILHVHKLSLLNMVNL